MSHTGPLRIVTIGQGYVADPRMTAARPIQELLRALGHEVGLHAPFVPEFDGQPSPPLTEQAVREVDVIAVLDACGALARSGGSQVIRI
jgi:hypothetical protein